MTFDDLTVPQLPDFQLKYFGSVMRLVPPPPFFSGPGDAVYAIIVVVRLNGSTGPLQLSASNLSPGVLLAHVLNNDATSIVLGLAADDDALPVQNWNVVVTAAPPPSAGQASRSISIPVTVLDWYDARIVGIEITQGIQEYDLTGYDSSAGTYNLTPFDYGRRFSGKGTVVGLASGGKTIVRVFANIGSPPKNSELPAMDCLLHGSSATVMNLPGSPLSPENAFSPQLGLAPVGDNDRANPNNGYYFTLPPSWTSGFLNLRATIAPTASFFPPENADSLFQNDEFTLADIPFTPTRDVWIAPISCRITNPYAGGLYAPNDVLEEARNLLPIGDHQFFCGLEYSNTIDITDIYNQNDKACGILGLSSCPEARIE